MVNVLLENHSFYKLEIYKALREENSQFIGRVIGELIKGGYLTNLASKSKPQLCWSAKKEEFNVGRWIDQRVFTATVKRSPSIDRPRERLLRLGPSELKISELLAILIRSGLQGESAMQAGERLATLTKELRKGAETLGLRILDHIIHGLRRNSSRRLVPKIKSIQELFSEPKMGESLALRATCRNLKDS